MLHGLSRRKAASGRCRAGFESRGLLPENAVRHLKLASCLPKMPPSISKLPATSPKCCTASQGGELLLGDAARELQILNSFRRCRAASENRELLSGNAARQT